MKQAQLYIVSAFLGCALLLSSCGPDTVSGGGSEAGNGMVAGVVVDKQGQPAAHAQVRLRPADFHASQSGYLHGSKNNADGVCDEQGRFVLDGLEAGRFVLECVGTDSLAAMVRCTLLTANDSVALDTLTVVPMARLQAGLGSVQPLQGSVVVSVLGLERRVELLPPYDFSLALPAGQLEIEVRVEALQSLAGTTPLFLDSAQQLSLTLYPYTGSCAEYACDSLVVAALLSANGITTSSVRNVTSRSSQSGRITTLELEGYALHTLPPTIGALSALTSLNLDNNQLRLLPATLGACSLLTSLQIEDNQLETVPDALGMLTQLTYLACSVNRLVALPSSIGNLKALTYLSASANRLTLLPAGVSELSALQHLSLNDNQLVALPDNLGALNNLTALYLDVNELTTLPGSIMQLDKLGTVAIEDNRLCTVSKELAAWLTQKNSRWQQTQRCP
jgi:hypothetical protein